MATPQCANDEQSSCILAYFPRIVLLMNLIFDRTWDQIFIVPTFCDCHSYGARYITESANPYYAKHLSYYITTRAYVLVNMEHAKIKTFSLNRIIRLPMRALQKSQTTSCMYSR